MKKTQTKEEAIESVKNGDIGYYETALCFARNWVEKQFKEFSSEEFKRDFYESGNLPPREPKIFGAVFKKLITEKLIFPHGTTMAKEKVAHGRLMRTYISLNFRLKQQQNRKQEQSLNLFEQ